MPFHFRAVTQRSRDRRPLGLARGTGVDIVSDISPGGRPLLGGVLFHFVIRGELREGN